MMLWESCDSAIGRFILVRQDQLKQTDLIWAFDSFRDLVAQPVNAACLNLIERIGTWLDIQR